MVRLSKKHQGFTGNIVSRHGAEKVSSVSIVISFEPFEFGGMDGVFSFGQSQYRLIREIGGQNQGLWAASGGPRRAHKSSSGPEMSISTNQKEKSFVGLFPRGTTL